LASAVAATKFKGKQAEAYATQIDSQQTSLKRYYISDGAKTLKHKILGPIGLIFAAAILYAFAAPSYRQGEPSLAGRKAEDFALQIPGAAHLSDLRGKVVILNFWASWCPPCLEETQSLNTLQELISRKGGVVLGVSVDDDDDAYKKFLADNHVIFPTYRDATKKSAADYGTSMYPETYLIDRSGRLARKIVGPQDWESPEVMSSINVLLNQ
jgi:cytochrome c biogenesis protein CcmG, thiol:disulfide interchange protein DsbE